MDHDQLEHFIIKTTHHDNDLGDESEMEETGESTWNIFDVLNDEEVEWLLLLSVYIFCWKSPSSSVICFYFLLSLFACIFPGPSAFNMFLLIANRENKFREFHYQWWICEN